jgi:hypothetical protein
MAEEQLVPREEAQAVLTARRELGSDFDDALVESFAQRVDAIAVTQAGMPGLVVAWVGIVLVNVVFARSR